MRGPQSRILLSIQGRKGIALPMVLIALIILSVLVTTALVTATTEYALSTAHQESVRGLWEMDGALERFVELRSAVESPEQPLIAGSYPLGTAIIDVAELAETYRAVGDGFVELREIFALVARPTSARGRVVGALLDGRRRAESIDLDPGAALVLGGQATLSGVGLIDDGSNGFFECDRPPSSAAIRHSSEAPPAVEGSLVNLRGDFRPENIPAQEMMQSILFGRSITELAALAGWSFGSGPDRPFVGVPGQQAPDSSYRWGCPVGLMPGCHPDQAALFPIVVIDASVAPVEITSGHGQGVLLIVGGDAHLGGEFRFAGMILVEGNLRVTGAPQLNGAVVVLADDSTSGPLPTTTFDGDGYQIRYDPCQIGAAIEALNRALLKKSPQRLDTPTYGWFEVVR